MSSLKSNEQWKNAITYQKWGSLKQLQYSISQALDHPYTYSKQNKTKTHIIFLNIWTDSYEHIWFIETRLHMVQAGLELARANLELEFLFPLPLLGSQDTAAHPTQ